MGGDLRRASRAEARQFALANDFAAKPGACLTLPAADGKIAQIIFGLEDDTSQFRDLFRPGSLPGLLPPGIYRFANAPHDTRLATLAFALGSYRFSRYRKSDSPDVKLVPPEGIDVAAITRMAEAARSPAISSIRRRTTWGRRSWRWRREQLAKRFGASFNCIVGDDLPRQNFPLIHAVGMASSRAPRLIDLTWGNPDHPKVTLVGKGVCFDTGGLDLKPSSGMLIMKKDMGGAANVLALAQMVMDAKLKVRLRVLIPAVENAVAGNAFRPLDIFTSRKGITVEIGNTDAEGRLVLADALALADEEKPDLLIDLGTLTGAARVALGPDLPPFYTNDETLALDVARCASRRTIRCGDCRCGRPTIAGSIRRSPISTTRRRARLPARSPARCSCSASSRTPKAGCMSTSTAGRRRRSRRGPEGGECQAARAIYKLLGERYG